MTVQELIKHLETLPKEATVNVVQMNTEPKPFPVYRPLVWGTNTDYWETEQELDLGLKLENQ